MLNDHLRRLASTKHGILCDIQKFKMQYYVDLKFKVISAHSTWDLILNHSVRGVKEKKELPHFLPCPAGQL